MIKKYLISLVTLSGIVIIILLAWFASFLRTNETNNNLKSNLLSYATEISKTVDLELAQELTFTPSDTNLYAFQIIRDKFFSVGKYFKNRGIYTIAKQGDKLVFGPENYLPDDPAASPVGTIYQNPPDELFIVYNNKQSLLVGPYEDEYGNYYSAFAPVIDPGSKEILFIIGIDVETSAWENELNNSRSGPIISAIIAIIILIGSGISFKLINNSEFSNKYKLETLILFPIIMTGIALTWLAIQFFDLQKDLENADTEQQLLIQKMGEILQYDEVLTMSARMFTATADNFWEKRYFRYEPLLTEAINECLRIEPEMTESFISQTSDANNKLIEMETRAFELVNLGKVEEGKKLIFSEDYTKQKTLYANGILNLKFALSTKNHSIVEEQKSRSFLVYSTIFSIMLVLFLFWVILYKTSQKRKKAEDKAREVILNHNTELKLKVEDATKELITSNEKLKLESEKSNRMAKEAKAANRAKSEFLANMSHEIRTPMNSILGFTEVLMHSATDNQHKRYLKTIHNSGKTLLTLINDILDLSKIESGKLEISSEPFDIRNTILEVAQIFEQKAEEKGISLITEFEDTFPRTINIDEIRFRQIILNLIGNAVKFTSAGYIKIILRTIKLENMIIDFAVDIIDTGIGIQKEQQERIFESFTQQSGQDSRKFGGTGLGLAISKKLCELMNGKLLLESEVEKGSKFTIEFYNVKFSDAAISSTQTYDWNENQICFSESTILIVDDVKPNRDLVVAFLEKYNLKLIEADCGKIGIELAKEIKPDLILMDLRMPGMTGYEANEFIKNDVEISMIPVIAFTASIMKSQEEETKKSFEGYLRKPVQKMELLSEIIKFLPHTFKENQIEEERQIPISESLTQLEESLRVEIIESFNIEMIPEIDQLTTIISPDDIANYIDKIKKFAEEKNFHPLSDFADELNSLLIAFELNEIVDKLKTLKKCFVYSNVSDN